MAQEFGDHPEAAVERMRWVYGLAAEGLVVLDTDAATARDARRGVRAQGQSARRGAGRETG